MTTLFVEEQRKIMDIALIADLHGYNHWANQQSLTAISRLNEESFTRPLGNSFSSVRETLVHILGAEWSWLERWNGRAPRALLSVEELPTLEKITTRWKQVEEARDMFLRGLSPSALNAPLSYVDRRGETWSYPLWQQMVHVVNHSTYHRGQLTTLLRQLGAEPVSTDLLRYYDEQAQGGAG